jgi:hypothetical protein
MNAKALVSVAAIFALSLALGFAVRVALLAQGYDSSGSFRFEQEASAYLPWIVLAHLFIAVGFVWLYLYARGDEPFLAQGVRFGAGVAVLMTIPTGLMYYAAQPMPGMIIVQQIVYDTIGVIVMGVVVAWLNR